MVSVLWITGSTSAICPFAFAPAYHPHALMIDMCQLRLVHVHEHVLSIPYDVNDKKAYPSKKDHDLEANACVRACLLLTCVNLRNTTFHDGDATLRNTSSM